MNKVMNTKIAVDVDEVLVHFLKPMVKWKGKQLPYKPKYNYLYREIFNCTEEESQEILKKFYKSREFRSLQPIPGSQKALFNMSMHYDKVYVLTGRQEIVRRETEFWIDTHFPGVFDDIILTNSFTDKEVKKVDICQALGIGLMIDDSIQTCRECIDAGIDARNFIGDPIYPWCEESDISIKKWDGFFLI